MRPSAITSRTGQLISGILLSSPIGATLVLDAKDVKNVEDNALSELNSVLQRARAHLIFVNADSIATILMREITVGNRTEKEVLGSQVVAVSMADTKTLDQISKIMLEIPDIERRNLESIVDGALVRGKAPVRLSSTPIKAGGIYNARSIVTNPAKFLWVSLALSDELHKIIELQKLSPSPILLAVSLRASPFAAILSVLHDLKCEIVDHMGPDHKIMEQQEYRGHKTRGDHIYIGDFCIGGTEVRTAEAYAIASGRHIRHALVIGSLLEPKEYFKDRISLHALISLKALHPDMQYTVF